jgi:long-chain acyl-CoA synthetase
MAGLTPETPGTFIYTSGTTGRPKAVVLTHQNLFWTASQAASFIGISTGDRTLSYLPLAHIAEQMFTIHGAIIGGCQVYYSRGIDKLRDDLVEVKPTLFFGVPRVWEKFYAGVKAKLAEATGAKAKIAEQAMTAGRDRAAHLNRGEKVPLTLELSTKAFDKVVYHKVKSALGLDQARFCASGAAPVAQEILEFFAGVGILIHEVYGQSEDTGPTTFNAPGRTKFGTVGPAFPGTNVKLGDDGEILVQGPNVFAGYYKDPEATAETLVDGWLHSGDLGEFDSDGFLTITGRKKDIIITAGGKNVAPKLIESAIKQHPAVSEAVLIGDERPYVIALVALDPEAAPALMAEKGWAGSPHTSPELRADLEAYIEAVNVDFGRVAQVKTFAVLPRDLSMVDGELTPTLKVKRNVVATNFSEIIEGIYAK